MTPTWSTACPDWERRIVAGESLVPFTPLFPEQAARSLETFGNLRVVDLPGRPTMRECCRPWVFDFAGAVFGSYDSDAGRQLINNFMLFLSKKNGKSTIAPGIMLTATIENWRELGEFFIIAPTKEVADNSFGPAQAMVEADEELSDLMHVKPNFRTIVHRNTKASLKVIAADSETVSGKKGIGVLIEELWLFGEKANAENMLREAEGGRTSRPEGFTINISTQSDKPPKGIFKQRLKYFRDVRDGKIVDPRAFGMLYEFPRQMVKDETWRNKAFWYITNPNLGASVDPEFLAEEFVKAEMAGLESLCGFAAKHLNVEIGISLGSDQWEGTGYWLQNAVAGGLTLEQLIARSDVAIVGIDGGGLDDLLGLAILGRDRDTRDWLLWSHAWAHTGVLDRRKSIANDLKAFQVEGSLTFYDEPGADIAELVDYVMQVDEAGLLPEKAAIGVDMIGISEIVDELERRGIQVEKQVEGVRQGFQLANTIKTTARRLAAGTLKHGGTQLMRFSVENAKVEQRGNAILITKQVAGAAKIDPLMALFDAVALMAKNPNAGKFIYEGEARELRIV